MLHYTPNQCTCGAILPTGPQNLWSAAEIAMVLAHQEKHLAMQRASQDVNPKTTGEANDR